MGDHVFVCYAREDEEFTLALADHLKDRGVPIWIDQRDIPPGADWDQAIDDALYECATFLIVLSPQSVDSREVRGELRVALNERKTILPVIYQECRVPRQLMVIQHADFTGRQPDDEAQLRQVLDVLAGESPEPVDPPDDTHDEDGTPEPELDEVSESPHQPDEEEPPSLTKKKTLPRIIWVLGSLAIILSFGAVLFWQFSGYKIIGPLAGRWSGTVRSVEGEYDSAEVYIYLENICKTGSSCGKYSVQDDQCSGNLVLTDVEDGTYTFREKNTSDSFLCGSVSYQFIRLLSDDSVNWELGVSENSIQSKGILHRSQ